MDILTYGLIIYDNIPISPANTGNPPYSRLTGGWGLPLLGGSREAYRITCHLSANMSTNFSAGDSPEVPP